MHEEWTKHLQHIETIPCGMSSSGQAWLQMFFDPRNQKYCGQVIVYFDSVGWDYLDVVKNVDIKTLKARGRAIVARHNRYA